MDDNSQQIRVEVAYAEPDRQELIAVQVDPGTTAIQAVELSGICDRFEALQGDADLDLGIFSKRCEHDDVLQQNDRVEIYRPLLIDPKEARRLKAEVAERRKKEAAQS